MPSETTHALVARTKHVFDNYDTCSGTIFEIGEDDKGHKMDEKAIYANVSKQIQSRKAAEANSGGDLGPVERSRSLSAQAKTFDVNKFRGTKPEKTFRLTLVKKGSGDVEQEGKYVQCSIVTFSYQAFRWFGFLISYEIQ